MQTLYIKWIANKDLLCHTGNHTQYFVITDNGRQREKRIHRYLSLFLSLSLSESLSYTLETYNTVNRLHFNKKFFKKVVVLTLLGLKNSL